MQPLFALLTLRAVLVLVTPGPEEGCPSARQVSAALSRHAPSVQVTRGPDSELTLVLPAPGTPQEPSVSLTDQQGKLRLYRALVSPSSAGARDCDALAVTVAIIVQRYLDEVELPEAEVPHEKPPVLVALPAPPPPPAPVVAEPPLLARARWDIALGIAQRFASPMGGVEAYSLRLSVARMLGARREAGFLVRLWSGVSGWSARHWDGGRGDVIRIPSGLELMWRRAASTVEFQLGLAGLLDCWILGARYQANVRWDERFAVAGAIAGGMQVPLGKRFFARVFIDVAAALVRYKYVDPGSASGNGFSTPSVFGDAGLALGMSLR